MLKCQPAQNFSMKRVALEVLLITFTHLFLLSLLIYQEYCLSLRLKFNRNINFFSSTTFVFRELLSEQNISINNMTSSYVTFFFFNTIRLLTLISSFSELVEVPSKCSLSMLSLHFLCLFVCFFLFYSFLPLPRVVILRTQETQR